MTRATALLFLAAFTPTLFAAEPEVGGGRRPRAAPQPAPLERAEGTHFTFATVTAADGLLSWNTQVISTRVVPVTEYVKEDNLLVPKTVNHTMTVAEFKKTEVKLVEFDITAADGKAVPADDVAKRLKAGGTLILLRNPLDDKSRKWFSDDALFFMPVREKGETRATTGAAGWTQLTHQTGTAVSLVGVKAKDGVLSWTERVDTPKLVTTAEGGVPVTRAEGGEAKYEAKETKLAEVKITDAAGRVVAAANVEKRLTDGGVLVRGCPNKADRKLFAADALFLEPPAERIEIISGPDRGK